MIWWMLATLTMQASDAPDPLAPAREGKIRCVDPDPVAHNCSTIIRYTLLDDGRFEANVAGLIERDPRVLIVYRTTGEVTDGAVCSTIRITDFQDGALFVEGKPATAVQASAIRARLMERLRELTGKRRCTLDQPSGGEIVANVTINGLVHPEMQQRVAWIAPDAGYAIGP